MIRQELVVPFYESLCFGALTLTQGDGVHSGLQLQGCSEHSSHRIGSWVAGKLVVEWYERRCSVNLERES